MEEASMESGWISDDSSFYGDTDEQERLELISEEFQTSEYWSQNREHELNTVTAKQRSAPKPVLSNPGEGLPGSWQLGETAKDFVQRLPPLTTSGVDWIWAHNPYPDSHRKPLTDNEAIEFTSQGQLLLAKSLQTRLDIKSRHPTKAQGAVTRLLNEESRVLAGRIADLAAEANVLSGKWMLFSSPEDLRWVWKHVVHGTINNQLGSAAKVAPDDGGPGVRLICVYTRDFRDEKDVLRVLQELVRIGLVGAGKRPIYYKPDSYTYLNIYRETAGEYGLQPSLYSSQKLLAGHRNGRMHLSSRSQSSLNGFVTTTAR